MDTLLIVAFGWVVLASFMQNRDHAPIFWLALFNAAIWVAVFFVRDYLLR